MAERTSIKELVEAGVLPVGGVLEFTRKGVTYDAVIAADGRVAVVKAWPDSISAASKAATGKWTNGWEDWKLDGVGLDDLEEAAREFVQLRMKKGA